MPDPLIPGPAGSSSRGAGNPDPRTLSLPPLPCSAAVPPLPPETGTALSPGALGKGLGGSDNLHSRVSHLAHTRRTPYATTSEATALLGHQRVQNRFEISVRESFDAAVKSRSQTSALRRRQGRARSVNNSRRRGNQEGWGGQALGSESQNRSGISRRPGEAGAGKVKGLVCWSRSAPSHVPAPPRAVRTLRGVFSLRFGNQERN